MLVAHMKTVVKVISMTLALKKDNERKRKTKQKYLICCYPIPVTLCTQGAVRWYIRHFFLYGITNTNPLTHRAGTLVGKFSFFPIIIDMSPTLVLKDNYYRKIQIDWGNYLLKNMICSIII